jgi:serine O-acetyltransferase
MLVPLLAKVGLIDASTFNNIRTQNPSFFSFNNQNCKIQPAKTFEELISRIVSHRLSSCSGGSEGNLCPSLLLQTIHNSFMSDELELGHTMSDAVREDALAVVRRDPACQTLLEVVLFMKGFASLVIHRAARRAWKPSTPGCVSGDDGGTSSITGTRFVALLLQSQASSAFGVDIHPAAQIGAGVMFDHASGIVVGETAMIGDGTTILHGVTLGGTGKENGDRHPKVGRDVLIGAGTKILGNIHIGDRVKIGAGSVVLRAIPSGATAVGAPARIIGWTPKNERPGSIVDTRLVAVEPLSGPVDSLVGSTITKSTTDTSLSTATAEMQATSISEEQLESSSSDIMESSDSANGDEESDEKNEDVHKKGAASKTIVIKDSKKDDDFVDDKEEDEEVDEGDDEDDKVTDFGTPARCFFANMSKDDSMCPFAGTFRKCPRVHSDDWISHTKLRTLLIQQGCSDGECVEVFFELLHLLPPNSLARKYGCIPADIFAENFVDIAQEKTSLDLVTCQALASGDLKALGWSKKASKRFKCLFSTLGKNSTRALSRISSASDSLPMSMKGSILGNGVERETV